MTPPRIVLLESLENRLKEWLTAHPDGHERGAFLLFRKFARNENDESIRYVAVDIVELDGDWILDSSPVHLRINMRNLPALYLRCEQEGLELGFVHNHPQGQLLFSKKDDTNEQNILRGYSGCNGSGVMLIALLLASNKWLARIRLGSNPNQPIIPRHISILGDKINIILTGAIQENSEVQKRQEAAFGKPFNQKLASLKVAVVGVGGTGSAVATLLARAGVGDLVLIDGDELESTNLNRVRGYKKIDVGSFKAAVLADFIMEIGIGTKVSAINEYLHQSPASIDRLSACDVIFGCTDDATGRDILNQACYYYGIPYIDCGLTGRIELDENGDPYLRDHRGRVSVIMPESGACLRCQRVVTDEKLRYEEALRDRPELAQLDAETLKEEYYLIGGGEQAPGVGPFTSATADLAVATLMDLVRPYRKLDTDLRSDNIWCDFVHMRIHSNQPLEDSNCFCCGINGIKLMPENGHRLCMPSLGRIN